MCTSFAFLSRLVKFLLEISFCPLFIIMFCSFTSLYHFVTFALKLVSILVLLHSHSLLFENESNTFATDSQRYTLRFNCTSQHCIKITLNMAETLVHNFRNSIIEIYIRKVHTKSFSVLSAHSNLIEYYFFVTKRFSKLSLNIFICLNIYI